MIREDIQEQPHSKEEISHKKAQNDKMVKND
jgi:hypothetical protein